MKVFMFQQSNETYAVSLTWVTRQSIFRRDDGATESEAQRSRRALRPRARQRRQSPDGVRRQEAHQGNGKNG